jgi:hypothetical protein
MHGVGKLTLAAGCASQFGGILRQHLLYKVILGELLSVSLQSISSLHQAPTTKALLPLLQYTPGTLTVVSILASQPTGLLYR